MSEVVKLQLIGLSVIGVGIVILLFVRAQFARVMGFVAIVLGLFSLVALAVPQMASLPRTATRSTPPRISGTCSSRRPATRM